MTPLIKDNNESFELKFEINSLPVHNKDEKVYLYEWFKADGEFIEEGHPIYRIIIAKHFVQFVSYVSDPIVAKKTGIVQICKKKGTSIDDGEKLYIIHPMGTYKYENVPSNKCYYLNFDAFKYDFPKDTLIYNVNIKQWHKEDGEFVHIGEPILNLGMPNSSFVHYSEKNGFLDRIRTQPDYICLELNEPIYAIHDNDQDRIIRKFINIPDIEFDEFTKKKIIKWAFVGDSFRSGKGITSLSIDTTCSFTFSFNNLDEKDFIVFNFYSKQFMLAKDDNISFLFEDEKIVTFTLNSNSYKIPSSSEKLFENKILLTDEELMQFEEQNLLKWKIILKKQNREITGGLQGVNAYESRKNLTTAIKKFAKEYRELVRREIQNYNPLLKRDSLILETDSSDIEECFVYLMIDASNSFHKIGISNKPQWREKTLQSEKPTIELIASKKFINRRIASSFERALHEAYSVKRIRGEWFNLNDRDLHELKITLNN